MSTSSIFVIGAGIVGMSVALSLQRDGHPVTVIDAREPGTACSFGNSGGFGVGLTAPIAMPGLLPALPRMLFDPREPLSLDWRRLPAILPWFARFVASSRPQEVARISAVRAALNALVFETLDPLVKLAGAEDLIERRGMMFVYAAPALSKAAQDRFAIARRHGVEIVELTGAAARDRNPALGAVVKSAVLIPGNRHTVNPGELVARYAKAFVAGGGKFVRAEVRRIEPGEKPLLITEDGHYLADRIVIAAGVWSKFLAAQIGVRVLLEAERGYHLMLGGAQPELTLPTTLADRNIVLTPMQEGVRITGIAEFAAPDAPPRYALADRLLPQAQLYLPGLRDTETKRWMGPRPSTPDSLPVIGPAPGSPNILLAFGHGQSGLAWASVTGKVIADLAAGRPPSIDIGPLSASRFN